MSSTAPFLSRAKESRHSKAREGRRAPQSFVARRVQPRMGCMNNALGAPHWLSLFALIARGAAKNSTRPLSRWFLIGTTEGEDSNPAKDIAGAAEIRAILREYTADRYPPAMPLLCACKSGYAPISAAVRFFFLGVILFCTGRAFFISTRKPIV